MNTRDQQSRLTQPASASAKHNYCSDSEEPLRQHCIVYTRLYYTSNISMIDDEVVVYGPRHI